MAQFRRVCFTYFPNEDWDAVEYANRFRDESFIAVQRLRYAVYQLEACPGTGRPHIQGYAEFHKQVTTAMLRELIGGSVHLERSVKSRSANRDYCTKEDTRLMEPEEFGEWTETQGKRNDLNAAIECMMEYDFDTMIAEHPAVFVRSGRGLRELYCRLRPTEISDEHLNLRPWQASVVAAVAGQPDDRTIFWVTDPVGGAGKSRLARHLVAEHGGLVLSGKLADMAYILAGALESARKPRIAVFDISRAQAEHVQHLYSMAEMIKNGLVVSNKYESRQLVFDPLHVVFFSNQSWDRTKFSHDRVKEMNIGAGASNF